MGSKQEGGAWGRKRPVWRRNQQPDAQHTDKAVIPSWQPKIRSWDRERKLFESSFVRRLEILYHSGFKTINDDLIEAFSRQLDTVYDDPRHDPRIAALADLEHFLDNMQESLRRAIRDYLSPEIQTAEEAGIMEKEEVAALVEEAYYEDANDLMLQARTTYKQKLAEIN